MFGDLQRQGWTSIKGVGTTADLITVANALGQPLPAPTGELVKALQPTDAERARVGSYSSANGRGEFPFHTDTAFWPRPSRYLVMRVLGDGRRPTLVLTFDEVWSLLGSDARSDASRSVWRTKRQSGGVYCSLRFCYDGERGWRYDPQTMVPANASAVRAKEEIIQAIAQVERRTAIQWSKTDCVVIDNWQCLHARGASPVNEQLRVLQRIYVR